MANHQINRELAIVNVVNSKLEISNSSNISSNKISNIPNDIPDNQLEDKVIQICREAGVEVD